MTRADFIALLGGAGQADGRLRICTRRIDRSAVRFGYAAIAAVACWTLPAAAQPAPDFYASKQITLIVGSGVGGGYDLQARLAARHLGKHIPGNPAIIVQNMPAAASLSATNYMASGAPRDGTTIALIQRGMLLARLTYPGTVRFE